MHIEVNGCRLYTDIVGSGLVAEGPTMVERPVVFLLHGGPGFDHSTMKPAFNPLSDGIKDALSVGIGFTSTTADFRVPVE